MTMRGAQLWMIGYVVALVVVRSCQAVRNRGPDDNDSAQAKLKATVDKYMNNPTVFSNWADHSSRNFYLSHLPCCKQECPAGLKPTIFVSGANEGQGISAMLETCPNAVIYGFEIQREVIAKLHENTNYASNPNMHLFRLGVSNKKGMATLTGGDDDDHTGGAGLYKEWGDKKPRDIVHTTTYADILELFGVSYVDYVLVDVEGHEVPVVHGMHLEHNKERFPVIQYELGGTWTDSRHAGDWTQTDMARYLQGLGYTLYMMGENVLMEVVPEFFNLANACDVEDCPRGIPFVQGNVLAITWEVLRHRPWAKELRHKLKDLH